MEKRARTNVTFNDLMLSPDEYRGKLVAMNLRARMIRKYDDPSVFDVPLYEVWGFTRDSGAWLYDAMVIDLPPGLKEGAEVNQDVRIVGYFFKLQGYYPRKAKPGARPERAPVLIGRMIWPESPMTPAATSAADWPWAWVLLGIFLVLFGVWLVYLVLRRRGKPSMSATPSRRAGAMALEEWFDHAAAGGAPEETDEGPMNKAQ
jgi:hypothetical protein